MCKACNIYYLLTPRNLFDTSMLTLTLFQFNSFVQSDRFFKDMESFTTTYRKAVKHITLLLDLGLDPAAPYYENEHIDVRLDPTDADFVDVIHTDSKTIIIHGFGTIQRMGHVDFFPNGGFHQIGCGKLDIG